MSKRSKMKEGPAQREARRGEKALEELWRQTGKPMCRLTLSRDPVTIFDSHIGGTPYCPHDGQPPVGEDGKQLRLVAQINFEQAPAMPSFPDRGILQIFLPDDDPLIGYRGMEHWTEQTNWRVVYHPEPDPTVTDEEAAAKVTTGPPVVHDGRNLWLNSRVILKEFAYKLHFGSVGTEGLTLSDHRFHTQFEETYQRLFPNDPPVRFCPKRPPVRPKPVDWIWADDIWKKLYAKAYAQYNKLGGFPCFPKTDPRTVLPELKDGQCPWDTVLLQLEYGFVDVNNHLQGYCPLSFGEGGVAVFLMREADLLRRDFSRVGYYWQDNSDDESFKLLYGEDWQPTERHKLSP